ncbi:hypothetical protein M9H77_33520 [Catharanthus roseus]|uniref:Uncharacterized protein n=1 Tax=Catharanthus roseus TaxID=4058 RepID=A0ACB9ZM46_CATRO|nr:hypothetical protein M9H77_33520 [Catharanthus roseus]
MDVIRRRIGVVAAVKDYFRKYGGGRGSLDIIFDVEDVSPFVMNHLKQRKRINLLMVAAFCNGASVEFLLRPFINIEGFIITVLVGSALVFGCFAAVASRFTRERFYAYFIAVRFAIIIILIWLFAAVHLFDGNYAYTLNYKLDRKQSED